MGLLVRCVLQTVYVPGAVVKELRDEVGGCMANTFAGRQNVGRTSGGVICNKLNGSMPSFLVASLVI